MGHSLRDIEWCALALAGMATLACAGALGIVTAFSMSDERVVIACVAATSTHTIGLSAGIGCEACSESLQPDPSRYGNIVLLGQDYEQKLNRK